MDFAAVILFAQQLCHLESFFLFWLLLILEMLLSWIKSQPVVAYKSIFYKNACNFVFQSSEN